MQHLDLNLLPILEALLQEESVTKAAKRVGLSTSAMSHALSRLRDQVRDPLLVRAGRGMVLTPRALALKPEVHAALEGARRVLDPRDSFDPQALRREFRVHATDHVLTILGGALDTWIAERAPHVVLRFLPSSPHDPEALREGSVDLTVGIYQNLPPELRTRALFSDELVCVVRKDHPAVKDKLTLDTFLQIQHVQIAPRGKPGGYLDDLLAEQGLERKVARAVPYFFVGLLLVASTNYVVTISERIARKLAPQLGLKLFPPPLEIPPYTLSLLWHPRMDGEPAHRWLREGFVQAAQLSAPSTRNKGRV